MLRTLKAMARRRGEDHHARHAARTGPTTICAASSAPVCRHSASRTTSRKPCLHTAARHRRHLRHARISRTRSARRWRHGRSTSRPSSTRPAALPRSSSCGGGGDDRVPEFVEFRYSAEHWDEIKAVVRMLGLDVDQIALRVTRIELMEGRADARDLPDSAINRQRLSRAELEELRKDAENLRARIAGALAYIVDHQETSAPHRYPTTRRRSRHAGRDQRLLRQAGWTPSTARSSRPRREPGGTTPRKPEREILDRVAVHLVRYRRQAARRGGGELPDVRQSR